MKLTFLGTGASDWPRVKQPEMTFFRRNSSCLINDDLLIDPGPGVPDAIDEFKIAVSDIKYVLNTHRHYDHYNENTLRYLTECGAEFIEADNGETVRFGGYTVKVLGANHRVPTQHYLINDGEHTLFYGMDGAWLLYEEFDAIRSMGSVDLAVLDGTVGFIDGDYRVFEHNNLYMVLEMKRSLAPYVKRFAINHIAYTLHTDHATLESAMLEHGIVTAYDGLTIDLSEG